MQNVINSSSPEAVPYLRLIQIGIFAVPAIAGIYLAIKNHEESK